VTITVDRVPEKENRIRVKVAPPGLGEIEYETCCGKFLPVITRYKTDDKDKRLLIVAVRVQTCPGK
jgi:hypothetical protein